MGVRYRTNIFSTLIVLFSVFLGCEGPEGPTGPTGPQGRTGETGPAGEVKTKMVTIYDKMYTQANSSWALVFFDDSDCDENTAVVWIGVDKGSDIYQNLSSLSSNVYLDGVVYIYPNSDSIYTYDNKSGYALLIYDYNKLLVGKRIKIQYIP